MLQCLPVTDALAWTVLCVHWLEPFCACIGLDRFCVHWLGSMSACIGLDRCLRALAWIVVCMQFLRWSERHERCQTMCSRCRGCCLKEAGGCKEDKLNEDDVFDLLERMSCYGPTVTELYPGLWKWNCEMCLLPVAQTNIFCPLAVGYGYGYIYILDRLAVKCKSNASS